MVNEFFHFKGTILQGQQEDKPRWEKVLYTTNDYLGMALGKLFVDKAASEAETKKILDEAEQEYESVRKKLDRTFSKKELKGFNIFKIKHHFNGHFLVLQTKL